MKHYFFLITFLIFFPLASEELITLDPLYAGTLLSFYPINTAPGNLSLEPFLFITSRYGNYDKNWNFKSQKNTTEIHAAMSVETGITQYLDIDFVFNAFYSHFNNQNSVRYGDTQVLLGLQLMRDKKGTFIPDFRLVFGESFPTGKYKNLNSKKNGSDASGTGSYDTNLILILQKVFYIIPKHPFNINLNLYYIFSTKTNVKGFNYYGGGFNTKGVVRPGNLYILNLGMEYSLTTYWEWGFDLRYVHQNRSFFLGRRGTLKNGIIAEVGLPSSESISFAPSLGYNYNENFSIIWGGWFSLLGRNSSSFASAVATLYYNF